MGHVIAKPIHCRRGARARCAGVASAASASAPAGRGACVPDAVVDDELLSRGLRARVRVNNGSPQGAVRPSASRPRLQRVWKALDLAESPWRWSRFETSPQTPSVTHARPHALDASTRR